MRKRQGQVLLFLKSMVSDTKLNFLQIGYFANMREREGENGGAIVGGTDYATLILFNMW